MVELVDDLVEKVLLRFPPKDPAALVRAALVCKRWRRLVSSPAFRRRFGEFHRSPPMLGMICYRGFITGSHFVPTTAFRPHYAERSRRRALDARHGRVLHLEDTGLSVWDPITNEEWNMPFPPRFKYMVSWGAAVLCSAAGGSCDHLDCHRGPFTVVLAASVSKGSDAVVASIYTYSSNADAWSEPTCSQQTGYVVNSWKRSALVGNTLYFADTLKSSTALKYNMQLHQMSFIQLPPSVPHHAPSALTTTEDGGLQFTVELQLKLYIWSMKDADEVDTRWEQNRVIEIIEINTLLPVDANLTRIRVVGSMDDLGTIFVSLDDAAYAIDLKTNKAKKVYMVGTINIVPYVTFYTPVFAQGSAMALPPAQLVDDLVEEVLLRFPPKDPAALVRAALVCKRWRRLVSSPAFRRRFGEFHRSPPMPGMFCNRGTGPHFVPTTAFRPHYDERSRSRRVVDARHGRVLHLEDTGLSVWDPITNEVWNVPFPPFKKLVSWDAAVLCSAAGGSCDHLDCHCGPFTVVLAASVIKGFDAVVASIYTYSSNADAWSEPTCFQQPRYFVNPWNRSALVGNTLYFADMLNSSTALKYNMQLHQMSWIQLPPSMPLGAPSALTTTEDGGLQFAVELQRKLYIWSMKDADEVDTRWEQNRVIELNTLLPADANLTGMVVGSMDDLGNIFVSLVDAAYAIDLKINKAKKVYEGRTITIVPYVTFYTPVALEAPEGPIESAGGSSA